MNKKQKIILFELVAGLLFLFLAITPVFNGKTGIEIVSKYISNNIMDAMNDR